MLKLFISNKTSGARKTPPNTPRIQLVADQIAPPTFWCFNHPWRKHVQGRHTMSRWRILLSCMCLTPSAIWMNQNMTGGQAPFHFLCAPKHPAAFWVDAFVVEQRFHQKKNPKSLNDSRTNLPQKTANRRKHTGELWVLSWVLQILNISFSHTKQTSCTKISQQKLCISCWSSKYPVCAKNKKSFISFFSSRKRHPQAKKFKDSCPTWRTMHWTPL